MSRNFYSVTKLIIPIPSISSEDGIPKHIIIYQLDGPGNLDIINMYLCNNLDLTFWDVLRICHFLNWIAPKEYYEATCEDFKSFLSRTTSMKYGSLGIISEQLAYVDIVTNINTIIRLYDYISPKFRTDKTLAIFLEQHDYLIHTWWDYKSIRYCAKSCLNQSKYIIQPMLTAIEIQSIYTLLCNYKHRTMFLLYLHGIPIETIIKLSVNDLDSKGKGIILTNKNSGRYLMKLPKSICTTLTSYLVSERKKIHSSDLLFTSLLNLPSSHNISANEFEELTTYNEFINDIEATLKKLGIKCFDWRIIFQNTNIPTELLDSIHWLLFPYEIVESDHLGFSQRMTSYYNLLNTKNPNDKDK